MFDCNYFWRAVSIHSDGSVEPCCHYNAGPRELRPDRKITDWNIQNHPALTDMRQTVLDGGIPKGCQPCVDCESNGSESPRIRGYDGSSKITIPDNEKTVYRPVEYIEHMDLFMNNICNFKCVMCSEDFSHLIAKEQGAKNPIVSWGDNEQHILKFMRKAKNLKKITIAGGEPFYNTSYLHKVLEAVSPVAHQIRILITTNGSNKIEPRTVELLRKFKKITLSVSVDATGKFLEMQRVKSNWKSIDENIKIMKQQFGDNADIELNSTITAITLPGLPDLLRWANDNEAIEWVHPVFVLYPRYLRIDVLKPQVIENIKQEILAMHKKKQFKWTIRNRCLGEILKTLDGVRPTATQRDKFDKYFAGLKKSRSLDLYKEFPEFKDWLM